MVVGVGCDSNKSCRVCFSLLGGCIRLAGAGGRLGHTGTCRTLPLLAQPDSASAQISHVFFILGLSISLVLLVLGLDMGQRVSGQLFLSAGIGLGLSKRLSVRSLNFRNLGLIVQGCEMMTGIEAAAQQDDRSHEVRNELRSHSQPLPLSAIRTDTYRANRNRKSFIGFPPIRVRKFQIETAHQLHIALLNLLEHG